MWKILTPFLLFQKVLQYSCNIVLNTLLIMKSIFTIFTILILIFSLRVNAESYSCSYDFNGENRPVLLKRNFINGIEVFDRCSIHFDNCGGGSYDILEETYDIIYLGFPLKIGGFQIAIIDKENRMFRIMSIYDPINEKQRSALIEGMCTIN